MKPQYFHENVYTIYPRPVTSSVSKNYEVETPESSFEWQMFKLFHKGKKHLYHEEFALAFDTFKDLSHLILMTVHPKLPPDPNSNYYSRVPLLLELLDPMLRRSAEILRDTPLSRYEFPDTIMDQRKVLPANVASKIDKTSKAGLAISAVRVKVKDEVGLAVLSANKDNWRGALRNYSRALESIPNTERELQAVIKHDMALISEKTNRKTDAIKFARESVELFSAVRNHEKAVISLETLSGIFTRSNKPDLAKQSLAQAKALARKHNLHKINTRSTTFRVSNPSSNVLVRNNPGRVVLTDAPTTIVRSGLSSAILNANISDAPALMTMEYLVKTQAAAKKTITINGQDSNVTIPLSGNLLTGMKTYYAGLSVTKDLGILNGYLTTATQMVAYLPHMYFYIIPIAMADCEIGMGKLNAAVTRIMDVLKYPFLNADLEVVSIWFKLADCYLDLGDESYKNAKDIIARYITPKKWYEKIVRSNGTIDVNSPLYKNPKFARIKKRIQDILAGPSSFISADGATTLNENPAILWRLREAETMLSQIKFKLNYFGFTKNYIPPFSFEYLQDTSRYFAQHASQMEQKYIQYKSTAENEELRFDQVTQQVELAQESVLLEQRGVAEAQAGIEVSETNRDYAETRRKNAVDSKNEFNAVRWELLEYSEAEAWANASSVDRDDQVKLTWNGHYYNSSKKRRNQVIQDLAYRKTKITHDLQANKLVDEVAAATAYKAVAEAQLDQARVRKDVAEKRVEIAQLQQKHAEENRDFLDLKEFGAGQWYNIAKKTKRLVTRYLDQATEISMLMERAYNAETERGLSVIRYNYAPSYSGFLVGADQLTRDIDYFTHDYITNIKSKKAPVKKTLSLSDLAPDALERLLTLGDCQFETRLSDFDREFPGLYLCKVKNIELVFIGITKAVSVAGSLRNVGVSRFKSSNGSVITRLYPADVMPLSQYDIRQDALAFRFDPKDLKLFENNGLDTIWELRLSKDANDFDFREILDIHLILYYDGFHNTTLESNVIAALPSTGTASRSFSMRLYFPDELYYLRNNGEGILEFDRQMLPYNQMDHNRNETRLKVLGDGDAARGLTFELHSEVKNETIKIKTNNQGIVPKNKFIKLKNGSMVDKWTLTIPKADNPHLVADDQLDLSGIRDFIFLVDYDFKYNS